MRIVSSRERLGKLGFVVLFCTSLWGWPSVATAEIDPGKVEKKTVSVTPPEDMDWSYAAMWKRATATRERLCLNGYWRFQPLSEKPAAIPRDGWGYLHVPGYWSAKIWHKDRLAFRVFGSDNGGNLKWRGKPLSQYYAGWFERKVEVPAGWKGKRVFMEVNQVNTDADIYWNGERVGQAHYIEGAHIEVTDKIVPGTTNRVTVLVKAQLSKNSVPYVTAGAVDVLGKNRHQLSGISGDVFLEAVPHGARIGRCRVETSFEKRQAAIKATLLALPWQSNR